MYISNTSWLFISIKLGTCKDRCLLLDSYMAKAKPGGGFYTYSPGYVIYILRERNGQVTKLTNIYTYWLSLDIHLCCQRTGDWPPRVSLLSRPTTRSDLSKCFRNPSSVTSHEIVLLLSEANSLHYNDDNVDYDDV